jgi:phage gp37-like protein
MNPFDIKVVGLDEIQCAMVTAFKECLCDCISTIEPYAGQFNSGEVTRTSFTAPALFVTAVSGTEGERTGEFDTQFAAFLLTKSAEREERAEDALALIAKVIKCIRTIHTKFDCQNVQIATRRSFQNLYSANFDKQGIQCWAINWRHVVTL